jgi:hypothetical protein
LVDEPVHPIDVQDTVAQHLGHGSATDLLDHESQQQIVGVRISEYITSGGAKGVDQV